MKSLILSAGLGTRLLHETHRKPKALVEVGGKPLLQHAIEKMVAEGITEIIVNVHHYSHLVKDFLAQNYFGAEIIISDESEKLLDTGGALKKASGIFNIPSEPVLVYNVDILSNISLKELYAEHKKSEALATLVVRNRETFRYFQFDTEKRLRGWINKKTGEEKVSGMRHHESLIEMAFSGISIINPDGFNLFPKHECFSLTDFYLQISGTHLVKGYFDHSDLWLDAGKPETLRIARDLFN